MIISDDGARALASSILLQATSDYFRLQEMKDGKRVPVNISPPISVSEIGAFFRSEWCGVLMEGIGGLGQIRQNDLMSTLARLYLTGRYKNLPSEREAAV